jgi:hypothetical protein
MDEATLAHVGSQDRDRDHAATGIGKAITRRFAESRGVSKTVEALRSTKTVLLRTYKRDGTPVPTPVSRTQYVPR